MALSNAERQRRYRQRKKQARLAAVPSLAPVESGAAPDGGLGPAGQRLWDDVTGEFELSTHEEAVLLQAARCADRLEAIAAALEGAELVLVNMRGDRVINPLMAEARQQSLLLARLCASLQLPAGLEEPAGLERSSRRTHRPSREGFRGFYQPRGGA